MTRSDALIREAEPDDATAMQCLWRTFWSPQPYESHLPAKIESDPDLVLVAELDGEIVGTAIGGFDGWWAWIYRVAVHPERHEVREAPRWLPTHATRRWLDCCGGWAIATTNGTASTA